MNSDPPTLGDSIRKGHEVRDIFIPMVVWVLIFLAMSVAFLMFVLWQVSVQVAPAQKTPGASPPVTMAGQPPVDDRLARIPPPRLGPLEPLAARPESYRSSEPSPNWPSPYQRPEDLRADRQPLLQSYGWIEPGKVARIPIERAMKAYVHLEASKYTARHANGK
jgi:hypothetical protein